MKEIQQIVEDFRVDRPTMSDNNTLERVFFLLGQELEEVEEVLDIPDKIGGELSDVIIFALTLANLHGINMDEEIRLKLAVNHGRYQAHMFQDGSYEEARKEVKKNEDEVFRDFESVI